MIRRRSKDESIASVLRIARRIEWPTIGLAIVIHAAWLLVTLEHDRIGLPGLIIVGGWITAWHGSLQHEVIHGHPTPSRRINHLFGAAPLSLWLPFEVYRRSHLAHHATEDLTDPSQDPESRYLPAGAGLAYRMRQVLAHLQTSLLGRLAFGPPVEITTHLVSEARAVIRGDAGARLIWARHALSLTPVLLWLHFVCHLSLICYGLCFIYPGSRSPCCAPLPNIARTR